MWWSHALRRSADLSHPRRTWVQSLWKRNGSGGRYRGCTQRCRGVAGVLRQLRQRLRRRCPASPARLLYIHVLVYFAPLMCDVRNTALRQNVFSFDQPMFAVIYGQSNCGKSSLIETLMRSMFSYPRIVETQSFTRSNLRGLQQAYRRFPVVFDDVT